MLKLDPENVTLDQLRGLWKGDDARLDDCRGLGGVDDAGPTCRPTSLADACGEILIS
jgi:hypothetical protein